MAVDDYLGRTLNCQMEMQNKEIACLRRGIALLNQAVNIQAVKMVRLENKVNDLSRQTAEVSSQIGGMTRQTAETKACTMGTFPMREPVPQPQSVPFTWTLNQGMMNGVSSPSPFLPAGPPTTRAGASATFAGFGMDVATPSEAAAAFATGAGPVVGTGAAAAAASPPPKLASTVANMTAPVGAATSRGSRSNHRTISGKNQPATRRGKAKRKSAQTEPTVEATSTAPDLAFCQPATTPGSVTCGTAQTATPLSSIVPETTAWEKNMHGPQCKSPPARCPSSMLHFPLVLQPPFSCSCAFAMMARATPFFPSSPACFEVRTLSSASANTESDDDYGLVGGDGGMAPWPDSALLSQDPPWYEWPDHATDLT
ncbi:hypothetical protein QBC46DRAFT_446540 [Diplogelasinospora grovesii]|uniref:Uncharacterized protein n=1 Tax=Diplogelasinospora grovesii TaxID=303347 RepID=A0AAN6NFT4_9PEZI|nr:hypothetical protein QBC46DRAFT_446540 [Diplogelasinospora grovesii]